MTDAGSAAGGCDGVVSRSRSPSRCEPAAELVFRVATSLIFVVGGLGHFFQDQMMMDRIARSPWLDLVLFLGDPLVYLYLSGAVLLVGGLMLLAGWQTRVAAAALFLTLVPITFVIHIAPGHVGPLLKNVAILGALGWFFVHGSPAYSLDGRGIPPEPGGG